MDVKDKAQAGLRELSAKFPVGVYRHYKGGVYVLYSLTLRESNLLPMVHYYSLSKQTRWTRDVSDWTMQVEVGGESVPRFVRSRDATPDELREACGLTEVPRPGE